MTAVMSYYEAQSWQIPARQTSWDQPPPPSRSGTISANVLESRVWFDGYAGTSSAMQHEDAAAFDTQIEGAYPVPQRWQEALRHTYCVPLALGLLNIVVCTEIFPLRPTTATGPG